MLRGSLCAKLLADLVQDVSLVFEYGLCAGERVGSTWVEDHAEAVLSGNCVVASKVRCLLFGCCWLLGVCLELGLLSPSWKGGC